MNFLLDFPRLKVYADMQYMRDRASGQRVEAYVFAVTLLESRPLLFTIHTIDGVVYSRLPIEALAWKQKPQDNSLDSWGAISGSGQVVQHPYLKDYSVKLLEYKNQRGRYWCTIDFNLGGFSQDPEQHKTSNIILADTGAILALPNNELLFLDDHFTQENKNLLYKRNTRYYL